MNDVNGKQLAPGDYVNIVCKIVGVVQEDNHYKMELELKYRDKPYHIVELDEIYSDQVVKHE